MRTVLKNIQKEKQTVVNLRVSATEKNKILKKAKKYTRGNVSAFIKYATLNFIPSKNDLTEVP